MAYLGCFGGRANCAAAKQSAVAVPEPRRSRVRGRCRFGTQAADARSSPPKTRRQAASKHRSLRGFFAARCAAPARPNP